MARQKLPIFCCLLLCWGAQLGVAKDFAAAGANNFLPLSNKSDAPTLPWIQRGNAYVQVYEVPLALANQCVPSEFKVVETKAGSGVTSGSLYIVKYDNRSSIEYSELIFICATVEYQGQKGNWVSSIYVDNKIAQQAGIDVWGLPKKLATFEWDRPSSGVEHVVVTGQAAGVKVLEASFHDRSITIPFMHQTIHTFGLLAKGTILLSDTEQKYGVKMFLKNNVYNVSSQSPLHKYMAGSKGTTKVEMSDGWFNMSVPRKILSSGSTGENASRASGYFKTTPSVPPGQLKVQGTIPQWLKGSLIRNSPGQYEDGEDQVRHWNDGWAQLHRWHIDGGTNTASHESKMLNTTSLHKANVLKKYTQAGYGTPANPGQRPHKEPKAESAAEKPATSDSTLVGGILDKYAVNPMVNVWKFDNKYMATTDQNLFIEFDPNTLATKGGINHAWDPEDPITKKGLLGIGTAHGRYDRFTKEHYWLEIDMSMPLRKAKYNVWTYQETNFTGEGPLPARKILGSITDANTSFVHSFGLTKNYLILIQCPMHYHFLDFVTAKQVTDAISWDKNLATKFHIMDRHTGALVRTVDSADGAWFVYHVLNAYEEGDGDDANIVIDFSKYHNDSLITYGMYLENLVDRPKQYVPTFEQARLTRCSISLTKGAPECHIVVDKTFEMATFNWVNYHMVKPRYSWGASFVDPNTPWHDGSSDFIDQLIKVDSEKSAIVAEWHAPNTYICEPLFVPHPEPKSEDDGALIFVAYDATRDKSVLMILDGATMKEIARADMNGKLAANFHGKFCPAGETYCIGL
jgi:beta,beta-carotene 9',10'-dioxygenase